jgi:GTP:adenosylcobinamide-phosphate guanylyltransferase
MNDQRRWSAIVLAASRGSQDPMAIAYGTNHKCLIEVAGIPMLSRVVSALDHTGLFGKISVSIEPDVDLSGTKVEAVGSFSRCAPSTSAPASALAAAREIGRYPILVTTGDHALLTADIVRFICETAGKTGADFSAGIAAGSVIRAAYPKTKRTYFRFGPDEFSGCNLFAVQSERGLAILERWKELEQNRKKPWRLVAAFGLRPVFMYLTGKLTVASAFDFVSAKLGINARAVWLPFAEAAIDVDKPSDKELAEKIIAARSI